MRSLLTLTIISLLIFTSCDDTFNLNAEWSDITIIYGVLNQADTAHYIKVNKAFLGDESAYEMAKEADSIQYADDVVVQLIEYILIDVSNPFNEISWERTSRDPILFDRTNEILKDSVGLNGEEGIFGTEVNYLYKSKEKLKTQYKYILEVLIPNKDEVVASETFLIGNMFVEVPRPNNSGTFNSPIHLENYLRPYATQWQAVVYGKLYETVLRFRYLEMTSVDTTSKYIDIKYTSQISEYLRMPDEYVGKDMTQAVGGADFFFNVGEKIDADPDIRRKALALDFIYYVGGTALNTYIASSESANSQGNQYSNIANGKGIFASSFTYVIDDKTIADASIDSLAYGYYTKELNFANYLGQWK